jgi:hypothetical protein
MGMWQLAQLTSVICKKKQGILLGVEGGHLLVILFNSVFLLLLCSSYLLTQFYQKEFIALRMRDQVCIL